MCVFCDKDKIKSDIIEIENCYIFEPLNPVIPGHLLVVNKIHFDDFTSDEDLYAETSKIASRIAKIRGGDFNLITSKGECATQTVFHCHIHLVPRIKGDGLLLPWSNQH